MTAEQSEEEQDRREWQPSGEGGVEEVVGMEMVVDGMVVDGVEVDGTVVDGLEVEGVEEADRVMVGCLVVV